MGKPPFVHYVTLQQAFTFISTCERALLADILAWCNEEQELSRGDRQAFKLFELLERITRRRILRQQMLKPRTAKRLNAWGNRVVPPPPGFNQGAPPDLPPAQPRRGTVAVILYPPGTLGSRFMLKGDA